MTSDTKGNAQRPYTKVYHDFLKSRILSPSERTVFIFLSMHANQESQAWPSLNRLADETGLSKRTVQRCIEKLKEKGAVSVQRRESDEQGHQSNLYTLHDKPEIWTQEPSKAVIAEIEATERMEAEAKLRRYKNIKKEPVSDTDQSFDTDPNELTNSTYQDNSKSEVSQQQDTDTEHNIAQDVADSSYSESLGDSEERYNEQDIKDFFDFDVIRADLGDEDADMVLSVLYDLLNTRADTIRIGSEMKPSMVVIGKLMRLDYADVCYAVNQFNKQSAHIKNPSAYLRTLLYHAKEQNRLNMLNEGHVNGDF